MIRSFGDLFCVGKLIPDGQQIGLMVPRMRPALRRVHPCFSIRHGRAKAHVRGTNVSSIFILRCSFLAMGVSVTPSNERMIRLTRKLSSVDTGPWKSDILRVTNQLYSACDLCDQSKQVLNLNGFQQEM